jgi:hypothetical protein
MIGLLSYKRGQAKTTSAAAYQAIGEELLALIEGRP